MAKRATGDKSGKTAPAADTPGGGAAAAQETLARAMGDHGAGRLDAARAGYERVLAAEPDNAAALQLLGVLVHQDGDHERAVDFISRALAVNPGDAKGHYNLGIALQELGRLDDALASYKKAIDLRPDFAEAECNRGNLLHAVGRLDDAVACFRRALELKPHFAEALYNLGNALKAKGVLEEAADNYADALSINPDFAEAHNNLGSVLLELNRAEEAEASIRQGLALKPESAEALINLGNALKDLERLDEAADTYGRALALKPDLADAQFNIGMVRRLQGDQDAAVAGYRAALAIDPDHAGANRNLGSVLHDREQPAEAERCLRRALEAEPDDPATLIMLGNALRDIGFTGADTGADTGAGRSPALWDEVLDCAEKVLAARPGDMGALGLKTSALIGIGRLDDWARLCDFDNLMQTQTMAVPDGYDDLAAFNDEILERCANDPTLIKRPRESMTAGSRIYNLQNASKLGPSHPLLEFMNAAVERYREEHAIDAGHPFLAKRPPGWRLDVWGSILDGEGQMRSHNHPEAWLSGVYYAKLPDVIGAEEAGHDGWIEFGRPPRFRADEGGPEFPLVRPREGLLILWPSFIFHRTVPYDSGGIRFSIAVDVMPADAPPA